MRFFVGITKNCFVVEDLYLPSEIINCKNCNKNVEINGEKYKICQNCQTVYYIMDNEQSKNETHFLLDNVYAKFKHLRKEFIGTRMDKSLLIKKYEMEYNKLLSDINGWNFVKKMYYRYLINHLKTIN